MTVSYLTLDISRLLSRSGASAPSGIDRVELAYAQYLLREAPERTEFAALHPLGRFGSIPFEAAKCFIEQLAAFWNGAEKGQGNSAQVWQRRVHRQILLGPNQNLRAGRNRSAYLLLSHHHLSRPRVIARTIARRRDAFIPMVHDLIPSEYPEFATPKESLKHLQRLNTVAKYADGILVPSEIVRIGVLPFLESAGRLHVPVCTVPHGVHRSDLLQQAKPAVRPPYFVCLGTIEPRKNHLLLLNVWRRLIELHGDNAPHLMLIGRRGWENENVLDMIERCQVLKNIVDEKNALPDADVKQLLQGARALLCPSFVEGFGLPLTEALELGVNVICSDIPVFREVCKNSATFIDPLDGVGWIRAIEKHSMPKPLPSPVWKPHYWEDSIVDAMRFIERVMVCHG